MPQCHVYIVYCSKKIKLGEERDPTFRFMLPINSLLLMFLYLFIYLKSDVYLAVF